MRGPEVDNALLSVYAGRAGANVMRKKQPHAKASERFGKQVLRNSYRQSRAHIQKQYDVSANPFLENAFHRNKAQIKAIRRCNI